MDTQFPLTPKVVLLVSAHVLTSSWTSTGAFGFAETQNANFLGLLIAYTQGSETLCEIKVEATCDKSLNVIPSTASLSTATNWYQQVVQSATGGAVALTPAYYTLSASGNVSEVINPIKADGIKVSTQGTGTLTSAGTVTIYGIISWV